MTNNDVIQWIYNTCKMFGTQESTAHLVAAEFAKAFESGKITTDHLK